MIPKIIFDIAENGLSLSGDGVQKVPGIILTGVGTDDAAIGTSHQVFSMDGVADLGITQENNPFAFKHLNEFYSEAGTGAELWFMMVSDATTYEQMVEELRKLISDAGGRIRILGMLKKHQGTESITEGIDQDVKAGVIGVQSLAEEFAKLYMPFRVVISGNAWSGQIADLFDYRTAEYDRVNMLIANNDGSPEASIGLAMGRLARIPVQRSIARVKDGSAIDLQAYFTDGSKIEDFTDSWDAIDALGYTFFRTFTGRSGYYFTDDKTLCKSDSDFSSLARGLVMDEAVLVANNSLTEELSDEIPVDGNGNIHPAIIKSWQSNVENDLINLMVNALKLNGAEAFIDTNQDILTTDTLAITLRLQPVGYAKQIEVKIGYTTNLQQ
ncbi:DUF2586 family protein [Zunongwangia profunda]|uniref:DUF2586 family protein n=2 Tax=Zunongwangia profunda TaxID=398743 RepID=UPI00248E0B9C|nr:DUF2586 family protein [Zunongwangia profunda]|tara:strand:+ start:22502 stop:23653 length:1152 start_codon:yes stop_codon:yes gene_type:complete